MLEICYPEIKEEVTVNIYLASLGSAVPVIGLEYETLDIAERQIQKLKFISDKRASCLPIPGAFEDNNIIVEVARAGNGTIISLSYREDTVQTREQPNGVESAIRQLHYATHCSLPDSIEKLEEGWLKTYRKAGFFLITLINSGEPDFLRLCIVKDSLTVNA